MNLLRKSRMAGVEVLTTPAVDRAIDYARNECEPYLFNHSMRSWLFAVRLGQIREVAFDPSVVAFGTLLHDITLNDKFKGPRRFEVEAADLASAFAHLCGFSKRRMQLVWDCVALNSTPSIGLYKEPEVALCTAGICLDVVGLQYEMIPPKEIAAIVCEFPRLEMKSKMASCFCGIARSHPETTYDNFVRDFGERCVPGYKPPSSVDLLRNAPFDE